MTASVVIRCFNEERYLSRLLTGIAHQRGEAPEIILVDSGSTDRSLEIAQRFSVRIVEIEPQDFSFGRSLNLGCQAASGDLLVFVSAHCYPTYDDWLSSITRPFSDPNIVLAYGKQRGAKTTRFSEHRLFQRWFSDIPAPRQNHPFCNNANCAVRRSVWEKHPYDEMLTGLEDIDWAKRAIGRGEGIAYVPEAEIVHIHEETPRQVFNRYRREAMAFKRIFPHEHFGIGDFLKLSIRSIHDDLRVAAQEGVLLPNIADIVAFRILQYAGTFRGFQQHGPVTSELKRRLYYPASSAPEGAISSAGASPRNRIPYVDADGVAS